MKDHCKYNKILSLHLNDIKHWSGFLIFIAPFANEIANLLTITILKPRWEINLYPHDPIGFKQDIIKTFIDLIALGGIVYISSQEAKNTQNITNGFVIGLLYLIFAFAIPNLFMSDLLKSFPQNNMIKLCLGLVFIYILELSISSTMCIYKNRIANQDEEQEEYESEHESDKSVADSEIIILVISILIIFFIIQQKMKN